MTAWLGNVTLSGGSLLKYDLTEFRRLSLPTLLSDGLCAAMPIADLQMLRPAESFDGLGVNLSSLLESSVFNSTHVAFTTNNHEMIPAMAQSILSWALASVEELANGVVKGALMGTMCNGTVRDISPEEPDDYSFIVWMSLAIAAAAFVVVNGMFLCVWLCKRWAARAETETELGEPLLSESHYLGMEPDEQLAELLHVDHTRGMLFLHRAVPNHIRHFYPVIIIGALLLLLASNLSVGASVDLVISSDSGKTLNLPLLFAFSLGNTAREMYNAGIYSLLFLVVGFSGIWPYAKLLLMLFGWCTNLFDLRQRGCMLFLLDALGKFSLVDTFVLVLMMVSFRYHLVLEGLMTLDVFVNPGFGFFAFLLATSVSLIAGHVILYFHRQSLAGVPSADETKESLCRHKFQDGKYGAQRRMTCFFSASIITVILLAVVFLAVGMTKKSFLFEFGGLAGKLLGDDRVKTYSLLTLGTCLPQSAKDSSFGMTCLQMAYFFYSVIMPFSCLAALSVLFLIPMTLPWQQRIMAAAEITNAWSAVEVFALSIIASLTELSTFASFMIGHKCDVIHEFLADHFDDELEGDDTCYTVTCSVAPNVWYLVCGAVLNSMIVSFLLKVAHHAMNERMQRQEEKDVLVHDDKVTSHDLVSMLLHSKWCGGLLFTRPDTRHEESETEHQRRKSQGDSKEFWDEWREICSVT